MVSCGAVFFYRFLGDRQDLFDTRTYGWAAKIIAD